jgi:hypothetical protein
MQEHKITKEDGTNITWTNSRNNSNYFCLLYSDNKQKFKFTPNENLNCELFMIGGGGAGGYFFGGGGGAGASYINNTYTFKKNKTYTFEIGNGGMCDIADINKLFKSGLTLNIYNNTNINLLNLNFTNDDYSSLGIQSSGMMQSFNVNNITIPSSIFHNNTTYIWDGYIKTNSTGYFNVNVNSKIKTIIWFDKFVYTNTNALIEGNNITDVKIIQLESNRFYNIKIIAYNDDNNSNNFNISFEGCQLFNFDKNEEKYVYIPATDTSLTYRNDDNTFETIRCKGGGNGGCGFFNKNTNLDGGCGGGSGINKIKGSSIIGAIYNGYDGAVGDYCGGGGGIMSAGRNNIGGDGKIINWFNETLIFGAGGNAAKLSETRNLGYGCGGNGGECCYYSKLLINNNGNNGCILIYVRSPETFTTTPSRPRITEGFTDRDTNMLPDDSIAKKLIEKSFVIPSDTYSIGAATPTRSNFFAKKTEDIPYLLLIDTINSAIANGNCANGDQFDKFLNQTFIYDMLVISKLYAIIYRLYWYQFNYVFYGDLVKWKDFCNNAKIKFTSLSTSAVHTKIDNYEVYINNLFTLTNLNLSNTLIKGSYNTIYDTNGSAGSIAMSLPLIQKYINNFTFNSETRDTAHVPLYHNIINGEALKYLNDFNTNEITNKRYYNIAIGNVQTSPNETIDVTVPSIVSCVLSNPGSTTLNMQNTDSFVTRETLNTYYQAVSIKQVENNVDNYLKQRAYIYFEALNVIFNTNYESILANLNYNMHYYNLVVYNASILYGMVSIQKNRFTISSIAANANAINCYTNTNNAIARDTNTGTSEFQFSGGNTVSGNTQDIYIATINSGAIQSVALKGAGSKLDIYSVAPTGNNLNSVSGGSSGTITYTTASFTTPANLGTVNVGAAGSGYKAITTCTNANAIVGPTYDITTNAPVSGVSLNNLNDDLIFITSNIQTISDLFKKTDDYTRVTSNITNVSTENTITSTNFYNNQQDLNKTINEYNGELENFNNISFYYKLVVAFALLLTIIIIFIFGTNRIDNNSKISVYVIIIVMIIIAFILYKQFSVVKEGFTYVHWKTAGSADGTTFTGTSGISKTTINKYKINVERYINNLILSLTNSNIATNLNSSLTYIKKISVIKNEKAEIYKIKKMNLLNSIEILKKNANFYYYMIIAIFVSIIILNIGLILYLLNPAMVMQIVILCIIPFIVLIYYISYYIHKSTRLAENKNYWANYNPSSTTLEDL